MKHYKLASYILFLSIIWISCGDDDKAPTIEINSPEENTSFTSTQTFILDATVADNEELDFAAISITGSNDSVIIRKIELAGTSQTINESFELPFKESGTFLLSINVVDRNDNNTQVERSYEYKVVPSGHLDLNIKLQYDGEPLVMFEKYDYPDGKKIDFSRFSFYLSEMKLDETTIEDIEFHNLTNSHANLELAKDGYSWRIENIPTGNYDEFSFNIGVPAELNSKDPGEFSSGHPLAKPAENWFSWRSYIFLKIEGFVDLDGDGDTETGVALHSGADEALRNIALNYPTEIQLGVGSEINLVFDLYKLFNGSTRIFPIEENPQIHSLDQLDAVVELSNNLTNAILKQ